MRRREALLLGAMLLSPLDNFLAQSPVKTSRIIGIVIDSIHMTGLEGAEVMVSGLSSPVTTDSLGRFSIDSPAPGTYQVGVFHPLLESLGLTLTTKPFTVGYRAGTAPAQFRGINDQCVTLVVWTQMQMQSQVTQH